LHDENNKFIDFANYLLMNEEDKTTKNKDTLPSSAPTAGIIIRACRRSAGTATDKVL
jgi:hypothetical protein